MPKKLTNALSTLAVKAARPGRHADGGGLYLLVKDTGSRSWVFRYTIEGKTRDQGLGVAIGPNALSLAAARDEAAKLRVKVKAGIDPLAERAAGVASAAAEKLAAQVAAITFRNVAEVYVQANEASWRNDKHRAQWRSTLATYVYPVIGELPVVDVSTAHVLAVLEPIWSTKPETASRVRGRMETILDAAKARGYRTAENPARWRGHLAQLLPARSRLTRGHHAAMPYEAVPAFVSDLRERAAMAALALEFLVLTAARTGEVIGMTWAEIDLDKALWTVPATRMKAGREHRVPLSVRTLAILEAVQPLAGAFVFPADGGAKLSGMAMSMLMRRMKADATVHGFRSAFRDWAAERTSFDHQTCEQALAHTIGNKAEAAYRRGDLFEKRRQLMNAWATYCSSGQEVEAEVTPIRRRRAA